MRFGLSLQFYYSALQTDHGGLGSVVGAQFGEDVPDLAFDGFFADRELSGNFFVGVPAGNQFQDPDFRRREGIVGRVLGKFEGGISRNSLFPGMDRSDRVQEFFMQ